MSRFRDDTDRPSVPVREINLIAYLPLVQPTKNPRPDLDLNPGHRRSSASKAQQVLWTRKHISPLSHRDRPKYRNILNTNLFPPHISSSSLLLHVTCVISSHYSILPLTHPHWSLSSNHQLTPVSRSQTALFSMLHLTCGTSFLLLFVFLISLVHHHHPALLQYIARL